MVNLIKARHAGLSAGAYQIATHLGVEAGDFTPGELAALKGAVEDGDRGLVRLIESHEFGVADYHPENWAQLAAINGMDPQTSTAAELTGAHAD